ncbi:MAG TPA: hypothetical protein VMV91_10480 [Rhodocyclaceae bacterium]|nr:hypothetical protein [Rhodocyclaceae bacterium]
MFDATARMFRPTITKKFATQFIALVLLGLTNQLIVWTDLNQVSRIGTIGMVGWVKPIAKSASSPL